MISTHNTHTIAPSFHIETNPKKLVLRALAWLVAKNQDYRAQCHFKELTDEALKDVGLSR